MVPFMFGGHTLVPLREKAVWWPSRRALIVADLHLEKASCYARGGQMLPPYDSLQTLRSLASIVDGLGPHEIWCLGDSFHDAGGGARLTAEPRRLLDALIAGVQWTWITGNHDTHIVGVGGRSVGSAVVDGIMLRHEASAATNGPEISGHWHPKLRIAVRGRRIARACFVHAGNKLVLPAFGALTGGLDAGDPAIARAVGRPAAALVPTDTRLLHFDLA